MLSNSMSFKEHKNLINELTKLQLYFLWHWLKKHPNENFIHALRNRTDLCRKTDPAPKDWDIAERNFNTSQWLELEQALLKIYQNHTEVSKFESTAYNHTLPLLNQFAKKTYIKTKKFDSYQCGSLKYDKPNDKNSKNVFFHIGNAITPKSIFDQPTYLINCLLDLIQKAEKEYGANSLETETWLNSLPKWLKYFPEEWVENMNNENYKIEWHLGFWGQFISAKGTFNYKYAKKLRATNNFPFLPRKSHCTFGSLKEHLTKMQKKEYFNQSLKSPQEHNCSWLWEKHKGVYICCDSRSNYQGKELTKKEINLIKNECSFFHT